MLDNEYPPLGGGTGVVNQHVLEGWVDADALEVDLVTSSRTRDRYELEELTTAIKIHKVPVNNKNIHHSSNRELLTYAVRGWRLARKLVQQSGYDCCLAWAGVPAGGVALWLRWEFGLRYTVSLQGPDVPGFERRYRWVYLLLTPFIRRVWQQAARLTACSEQHRELAQRTEPNLPIQVIANGVDTSLFKPGAGVHADKGTVKLISAGRLIERKGQQHLISAISLLRERGVDVQLLLVGTGDREAALGQQVRDLGLEDQVELAGFVEWTQMPDLYRGSDVFVLPSYNEGMSIALLEAMATGLPVIVTNTGGALELVEENGLLVPWNDVAKLAEAIAEVASSPERRRAMGVRSREIAERFGWDAVSRQYLELCREIGSKGAE
jgi:glycosyltransferase involved in cell wall biosynthesis